MNFRPLSEYRRHGRACWRPDPVANDPKQSWNCLAAETTIARVDLSTDSGSIGPGR